MWRRLNREDLRTSNPLLGSDERRGRLIWRVYEEYEVQRSEEGVAFIQVAGMGTPHEAAGIDAYEPITYQLDTKVRSSWIFVRRDLGRRGCATAKRSLSVSQRQGWDARQLRAHMGHRLGSQPCPTLVRSRHQREPAQAGASPEVCPVF
jgi:hypothetical protein